MLNASSNIYVLNKANLCGTRPLKDVSHLTWVFVNENMSSSHLWSHCFGWCILNRFSMNLHTGARPVHVLCIIITDLWHSFDMLNTINKGRPGVSDLCSLTALFFHFFYIFAFCHLFALWLMFTKQHNRMTERERERRRKRVGCLGMSLIFVSLPFPFPLNLSNVLTLLYNPEMTSCSFSLIFFLSEFQLFSVCQQLSLLKFLL